MNTYKKRFLICNEIKTLANEIYPNDAEMLMGIADLVDFLQQITPEEDFINGLMGFINWMYKNGKSKSNLLTNLIHDVSEYRRNRFENWFSPRTSGYKEFADDNDYSLIH